MLNRQDMGDAVLWTASLNGETAWYVTRDKALEVRERGIADGHMVGVALLPADSDRPLQFSVHRP